MRIHVLSDLHLLRQNFQPPQIQADLTICAGDVDEGLRGMAWLLRHMQVRPVLYVPGNHEFYGESLADLPRQLSICAEKSSVTLLQQRAVESGGVRFIGCTLWTDFLLAGNPEGSMIEASAQVNDYRRIRRDSRSNETIRPLDIVRRHVIERGWLAAELARPYAGPTVVITHHAPSPESLPATLRRHPRAPALASDLGELIARTQPALWIHGHVHHFCRYKLGRTEVICNPHGYVGGKDSGFNPDLVVQL